MQSAPSFQISAAARRCVILCMIVALVVCACASSVAQVRSARHFHQPLQAVLAASPSAVRDVSAVLAAVFKAPAKPVFAHAQPKQLPHFHDELAHHHHDASDTSVVSVTASSPFEIARAELDASTAKAASALGQPSVLSDTQPVVAAYTSHGPWCDTPPWAPKTSELPRLRRPPKRVA